MYFYYIIQFSLRRQATDSSFCRIALLGFAIRVGTPVNMKEGKNQVIRKTTVKQLQSPP